MTPDDFKTNVDAFSVGHSSAFVPAGSVRVAATSDSEDIIMAAYLLPNKSVAVVAHSFYWRGFRKVVFEVAGKSYLVRVGRSASVTVVVD